HLWGVRYIEEPDRIEVLKSVDLKTRMSGVVGRRSKELFDADVTIRRGIPCVTAPRALDDLLRRKLCTLDDVRRCVGRLHAGPGRPLRRMHGALAERWPGYDPGE